MHLIRFVLFSYLREQYQQKNGRRTSRQQDKWRKHRTKETQSKPLLAISTQVSRGHLFSPTILDTRRASVVGECPGNERTADQKLVSKPEIPVKAPTRKPGQTGFHWSVGQQLYCAWFEKSMIIKSTELEDTFDHHSSNKMSVGTEHLRFYFLEIVHKWIQLVLKLLLLMMLWKAF